MNDIIFDKGPLNQEDKQSLLDHHVWSGDGPVGPERLSILTITYHDFNGETKTDGQMMVMDVIADTVLDIFKTLYEQTFPIQAIGLMDQFGGDDYAAMRANNTSCFNSRGVVEGMARNKSWSVHAYGLAIDINPVQNPMMDYDGAQGNKTVFYPETSALHYFNRQNPLPDEDDRPGMVEPVVGIFKKHGFTNWGGDWDYMLDYHHFAVPRVIAEKLANSPFEQGIKIFAEYKREQS